MSRPAGEQVPSPGQDPSSGRFLNIAHRGACAVAPENTIPAFRAALEQGASLLEMDLRFTKDQQIVVFHDANTSRTTNQVCVERKDRRKIPGDRVAQCVCCAVASARFFSKVAETFLRLLGW